MKSITKKFNKLIETLKIKFRRRYIHLTANIRKRKIKSYNFTIISNNCWAGFVYQSYDIPYNTPTLGMFFVADDYIKFLSNLEHYLSISNFEEVFPKDSKWYNELKDVSHYGEYPIARLDDIELHLLHYESVKDAEEAWNRRVKRINRDRMLVKFSEMNGCTEKNIVDFQNLKFRNKICFISKKYEKYKNEYTFVVSNGNNEQIKSSEEPVGNSRIVDINQVINNIN